MFYDIAHYHWNSPNFYKRKSYSRENFNDLVPQTKSKAVIAGPKFNISFH